MTREQFIELQNRGLDHLFSFTDSESEARDRFFRLALDTYDFLEFVGIGVLFSFRPSGETSENYFGYKGDAPPAPRSLDGRWREWNAEFPRLLDRNSRLALMYALTEISERHDAHPGQVGMSGAFRAGWTLVIPLHQRHLTTGTGLSRRFFSNDFIHCDDSPEDGFTGTTTLIVSSLPPNLNGKRCAQSRKRLRLHARRLRRRRRSSRRECKERLDEVMALARGDVAFWERLKRWELEREAVPFQDEAQPFTHRSGPIRAVALQTHSQQKYRSENPPLDPVLVEFVDRVQQLNDPLSRRDIAANLRSEIRRELGLTGSFRR